MSERFNQDWESALSAPWSMTGGGMTRSGTSVIDGSFDARLNVAAAAATWNLDINPPSARGLGSARGVMVQTRFKFALHSGPTGAPLTLFGLLGGGSIGAFSEVGAGVVRIGSTIDASGTSFATAIVASTVYGLALDIFYERDTGTRILGRMYDSGGSLLESKEHRDSAGSAPAGANFTRIGGGMESAKGSAVVNWGDIAVWIGQDPCL